MFRISPCIAWKNCSYWNFPTFFVTLRTKLASEFWSVLFGFVFWMISWMCISTWNLCLIWWSTKQEVEENHYYCFNVYYLPFARFSIFACSCGFTQWFRLFNIYSWTVWYDKWGFLFDSLSLPQLLTTSEMICYPKQTVFFDQVYRLI